jgi:hypothetical protein
MSMQTFVLSDETASMPVEGLIKKAAMGNVAVEDEQGKIVAYLVSPLDREAMAYLDAFRDFESHREEIGAARKRRGGVTTKELLERAEKAARDAS